MSDTNLNDASFTPEIQDSEESTNKQTYSATGSFRFWCQKVLPLVYDDSLSYYELLCKVVNYLNNVIQNVDNLNTSVDNTNTAFNNLQNYVNTTKDTIVEVYGELEQYVNDYFNNLDVQEEINSKLDAMASDGSLSKLLAPFIPSLVSNWLSENIKPTSPAVDASLSVSGAAADAKVTGDLIREQVGDLKSTLNDNLTDVTGGKELININDIEYQNGLMTYNGIGNKVTVDTRFSKYTIAYIPVVPNQSYRVDFWMNGSGNIPILLVDENDACILRLGENGVDDQTTHFTTDVTIPKDVAKMLCCYYNGNPTSFKKYGYPSAVLNNNTLVSNLVKYNANVGLVRNNSGNVTTDDRFTRYSYTTIECKPNDSYIIDLKIDGQANTDVYFCDEDDKIITSGANAQDNEEFYDIRKYVVPDKATKMWVCWKGGTSEAKIKKIEPLNSKWFSAFEPYNVLFKSGLIDTITNYRPELISGFETKYEYCIILANPGDVFHIDAVYSGTANKFLFELDSSGTRIDSTTITGENDVFTHYDDDYRISDDGYGLCICVRTPYEHTIKKETYVNTKEIINKITDEIGKTGYEGKTAVFFGTSIPAGSVNINGVPYSIPTYVGKLLNMTIINESVGSSMARRGWEEKKTENDPYGWTDIPWQNVFLGMGKNLLECEDLITNYNTKWKDIIGGDFAPAGQDGTGLGKPNSMVGPWLDRIRESSYENRLIPYLNGTKDMPDLFIFEHGHNDVKSFDSTTLTGLASVNPDNIDDYNRSLYGDVMAFYVRLIRQYNPSAKILIVSNYENDSDLYKRVFTSQKEVAESNKIWFCDVANHIGWSAVNKITTSGYWNNGTSAGVWINSGGSVKTITCLGAAFPDMVHPNTDLSGKAIIREAEIIANYIKNNISLD